jgi:anti-sigma factor RsiW
MTDCRSTQARLPAYVDAAITPDEQACIARHLDSCPHCRDEEMVQRGAATVVRRRAANLLVGAVPPGLETRCRAAMASAHPAARFSGVRRWATVLVPAAVAVMLIMVTAFALLRVASTRSSTVLAAELTADHVKCFRLFSSGTTRHADPMVLEAMLKARYGWNVHIPPSSNAEGLRLDGARKCTYDDGPIPHVMYQAHGQNVSLFILEGVTRENADVTTLGHRTRIWSRGRNTYVLVSSAAAGTLTDVVGYVQREVQ